jgi:hypothetical protein
MPVSANSRYYGLRIYEATDAEGEVHATVAMRLAPTAPTPPTVYQRVLVGLETLEYAAWDYYRASDAWWRIADANPLVFPLDWRPGMRLNLPAATNKGRVERTRRF